MTIFVYDISVIYIIETNSKQMEIVKKVQVEISFFTNFVILPNMLSKYFYLRHYLKIF